MQLSIDNRYNVVAAIFSGPPKSKIARELFVCSNDYPNLHDALIDLSENISKKQDPDYCNQHVRDISGMHFENTGLADFRKHRQFWIKAEHVKPDKIQISLFACRKQEQPPELEITEPNINIEPLIIISKTIFSWVLLYFK